MRKRLSLSLGFLLYVVAGFFVTRFVVQWKVDQKTTFRGDVFDNMGLAIYYAIAGYAIYFLIINATSIGGWVISRRLKDTEAISTFKATTALTVGFALLFFLYFFNQ